MSLCLSAEQKQANRSRGEGNGRCKCHPAAAGHRFGNNEMMKCDRAGCEVNWFQHQLHNLPCGGAAVPKAILANREQA